MRNEQPTGRIVPGDRVPLLGAGATFGGALLVLWITVVLVNPTGGYVGYLNPVWVLWNLGIGCGILGLYEHLVERRPRWSAVGAGIAVVGVTLSIVGVLIGGLGPLLDSGAANQLLELEFMLAVVGFFGMLLGSVVLGLLSIADGTIPRWVAGILIGGSILAVGVDDTDIRILLLLPYALSWVVIGYDLWTDAPSGRTD